MDASGVLEYISDQAKELLLEIQEKELEEPKPEPGQEQNADKDNMDYLALMQKILKNSKEISDESLNRLFDLIREEENVVMFLLKTSLLDIS